MKRFLSALKRLTVSADGGAEVSLRGRAQLLNMTQSRLVYSITVCPIGGSVFIVWLYLAGDETRWLMVWALVYAIAAVAVHLQRRRFKRDLALRGDEQFVSRWLPVVHRTATLHGLGLAAGILVATGTASFEIILLMHISIAATIAANATHQTPVLSAFQRFFFACWGSIFLMVPWSFANHWQIGLPLAFLFGLAIYRNALIAHKFFLQQVRLEDEGIRLAERYRTAKEEAERALQAKNMFLTTASHDLRQPVHAMGFLIEAIAHRNRDPALIPPLEDLRRSVRSVHLMFNSLLDLSKIESGVVSAKQMSVAIAPIMEDVATLFREEAKSRGLDLRVRAPASGASVLGDASLLRQSLVNLTHNALRYTQHGGVLLSARRRGAHWLLEVWDTGMGVATEEQSRIYSPFYRNEFAWRIDSAGHGLGLAVVARCATLMGATYGLDSVEGRGSRFWLRLAETEPQAIDPTVLAQLSELRAERTLDPLEGTCLVVEDDPLVASAWQGLMQAWGVDARCAASAREAFARLDAGFAPQAILCDQRLRSGESGFDVLKELFVRCPDASGAMVSGEFESEALLQAESEGYLVLRKPLEATQLHALLSQWLLPPDQRSEDIELHA